MEGYSAVDIVGLHLELIAEDAANPRNHKNSHASIHSSRWITLRDRLCQEKAQKAPDMQG